MCKEPKGKVEHIVHCDFESTLMVCWSILDADHIVRAFL